jgi:hypothetical protein
MLEDYLLPFQNVKGLEEASLTATEGHKQYFGMNLVYLDGTTMETNSFARSEEDYGWIIFGRGFASVR